MDRALENFEFCFDDAVIKSVLSGEIINFISTRHFSILMEPPFMLDGIYSKKNPHAFLFRDIIFGKQPNQRKTVWKSGIGQELSKTPKEACVFRDFECYKIISLTIL